MQDNQIKKEKKKMKLWKKITIITLSSIIGLILILLLVVYCVWNNELRSVFSINLLVEAKDENRSGPVYEMDMKGDYYFIDFLEKGGASNDQELIDHIVDNLTKGIIPMKIKAPTIGCSSFTAVTPEGDRLFGRNYDFSKTTGMIVYTTGSDEVFAGFGPRHATVSSVDLQFLGITDGIYLDSIMNKLLCLAAPYAPLDGINDAGVSCGIYMSYQGDNNGKVVSTNQQTDKPDLTSTTMLRAILDYADSVDEAVEIVSSFDLHDSASTSFHYMVADRFGRSAILEWVPENGNEATDNDGTKRVLRVYYNDKDEILEESNEAKNEFQYITNFIVTPAYYNSDENKGGLDRYLQIESMINPDGTNTKGVMIEEAALNVLETVGRRKWDNRNGESDKNGTTVWSTLYNLTNRSVTWVSNEEFDEPTSIFHIAYNGEKFVRS